MLYKRPARFWKICGSQEIPASALSIQGLEGSVKKSGLSPWSSASYDSNRCNNWLLWFFHNIIVLARLWDLFDSLKLNLGWPKRGFLTIKCVNNENFLWFHPKGFFKKGFLPQLSLLGVTEYAFVWWTLLLFCNIDSIFVSLPSLLKAMQSHFNRWQKFETSPL